MTDDDVRADDERQLIAIMEEHDPVRFAHLLFTYYHDNDRADRTSRHQMYLHLGMAALSRRGERASS